MQKDIKSHTRFEKKSQKIMNYFHHIYNNILQILLNPIKIE